MLILVVFGVLTGLDQPRLEANLPTPWMGLWERIDIFATKLWIACWPSLSYAPAGISNLALTRIADRSVVLPRLRGKLEPIKRSMRYLGKVALSRRGDFDTAA
jgi:hypothetical protein